MLVAASLAVAALAAAPAAIAQPRAIQVSNVTVTAGKPAEFHFIVAPGVVKSGLIVFKITNKGVLPHDFKLCSKRNQPLANSSCRKRDEADQPRPDGNAQGVRLAQGRIRVPLHRLRPCRRWNEGLPQGHLIADTSARWTVLDTLWRPQPREH